MNPDVAHSVDYLEYAKRLNVLHRLIRLGEGDLDESEAIRDEMDDYYMRLNSEEIESLEFLSADLYVLEEDRPLSFERPMDEIFRRQLLNAGMGEDWAGMRSLLDSDANSATQFDRIQFRAIYWAALKDYESSLEFLGALATRVEVDRSEIQVMQSRLDLLARAGRAPEEFAIVQEFGRLALGGMTKIAEEIRYLIDAIGSMGSSKVSVEEDPVVWDAVKEKILQLKEPGRAFSELAA